MGRYYLEIFFASSLLISILYENLRIKKNIYISSDNTVSFSFFVNCLWIIFLITFFVSAKKSSQIKIIAAEGYDLYSKVDLLCQKKVKFL